MSAAFPLDEAVIVGLFDSIGVADVVRYNINAAKRLANCNHLYSLAGSGPIGRRVLDVGCGSGLFCLISALKGAAHCTGVEIDEEGLKKADQQLRCLGDMGHEVPATFLSHDVRTGLPFEDASFDMILMEEVVSHLVGLEQILQESVRVLAPGGLLVISDSNNPFSIGKRRKLVREWLAFEKGPRPNAEQLVPHERSYEAMRAHRIRHWHPELTDQQVSQLAESTSGLWGDGLREACDKYVETDEMPSHKYQHGQCPVHPDGLYIERLIDPYELQSRLMACGCTSAKAIPHWASSSALKRSVDALLRCCIPGRLGMRLSRGYVVIGER